MKEIILNPDLNTVNWERISELFQLVGWGKRNPAEIAAAFHKSSVVCIVKVQKEIVGFGRTVDDGRYYALLVDVVIHPEYQNQGLGKSIVNNLKDALQGYEFITLTAAPGKEGFYQKIGWEKQSSSFIIPKNEKQRKEHCE